MNSDTALFDMSQFGASYLLAGIEVYLETAHEVCQCETLLLELDRLEAWEQRHGRKNVNMRPRKRPRKGRGKMNRNNLVAKHARTYNKAHVMVDRKKAAKRGYRKHRGNV